ncbi:MAG: alpha/beta hydrolase [Bacteriovoracia bacterium]
MPVVKKFDSLFLALIGLLLLNPVAEAKLSSFQCIGFGPDQKGKDRGFEVSGTENGPILLVTHEDMLVTSKVIGKPRVLANSWKVEPDVSPDVFNLLDEKGASITKFEVSPKSGGRSGYATIGGEFFSCSYQGQEDADQKAYQAAIQAWAKFKAREPKACNPYTDSRETIQDTRPKVTVVFFQGYAVSPGHMQSFQQMFAELGVNVLIPRLRGHFNDNPRDLDGVKAEEWIGQSEEVLKIASKMSPKVIVAGYSLGGLLASRLALLHPKQVKGLLAFSPAWRVTGLVKTGSALGSLFGISANEFLGSSVQRCGTYISAQGGREVERVISITESEAGGSDFASGSAFRTFAMPSLVANILDDNTVDGSFVNELRGANRSTRSPTLTFEKGDHMAWIYGAKNLQPAYSPFRGKMSEQVAAFFKVNKLLD